MISPATILAALLLLSPPARHRPPPGWTETTGAAERRYASIAEDISATARNPTEAAYLIGVSVHESGLYADVDAGACYRLGSWASRCDSGRATSIFQLQDGDPERFLRWRTDRRAAAREALRRIVRSLRACSASLPAERLAIYAGGTCHGTAARRTARSLDASVRRALAVLR